MRLLIIEDNQVLSIELADFFELQGDILDTQQMELPACI
jgi:hypothetical protein